MPEHYGLFQPRTVGPQFDTNWSLPPASEPGMRLPLRHLFENPQQQIDRMGQDIEQLMIRTKHRASARRVPDCAE